jgi:hypothetical protein
MKTTDEIENKLNMICQYKNAGDYTRGWIACLRWVMEDTEYQYIIKSGAGYLFRIIDKLPEMTTDPVEAKRMDKTEALRTMAFLESEGFGTELIELRIGRVK